MPVTDLVVLLPMSHAPTSTPDRPGILETGIERPKSALQDETGRPTTATAKELLDILEASDVLRHTIDFDKLPAAIDREELPNLVDLDHLADAIRERNPDLMFDASNLKEVIRTRELWEAVDLLEFATAKHRLDEELEDVIGEDALEGFSGDSKVTEDVEAFVSSVKPEAVNALVQQEAQEKVKAVQDTIVEHRAALEQQYEANKRRVARATGKGTKKSSAVSLLSPGPVPDSASTRLSTVPPTVRYARIDPLPRVFSTRWRQNDPRGNQ